MFRVLGVYNFAEILKKSRQIVPSCSGAEVAITAAFPKILKALNVIQLRKIRAESGNKVAKHVFSPTQYSV